MKLSNHWSPQEAKLLHAFGKGETKEPQAEFTIARSYFR